jgi:hypothetical protein
VQKFSRYAQADTLLRYDDARADHQGQIAGLVGALLQTRRGRGHR